MAIEVGSIVEGKVNGLTKFGAFIQLAENTVGMVHISEVSYQYVNDISEHLQVGQTVKVKVLSVDENGRIALSIKKAQPQPARPNTRAPFKRDNSDQPQHNSQVSKPLNKSLQNEPSADQAFEDKLKQFMQASEGKMSDLKHYTDRKVGSRRGRK